MTAREWTRKVSSNTGSIGKSNKRELPALPRGRQQIGKLGIGKLATYVLAERLTHINKSGKKYYSTSMDYRAIEQRVDQGFAPKTPIKIALHELTEPEAKRAVESWTKTAAFKKAGMSLFGRESPVSWTVSVMSSLKSKVHEIKPGLLRWLLRTALPLRPDFGIWLDGEKLVSSKVGKGFLNRWILGKDLIDLPRPAPKGVTIFKDKKAAPSSENRFGFDVPYLGRVTGYAEAYKDLLTGKSDEIGRMAVVSVPERIYRTVRRHLLRRWHRTEEAAFLYTATNEDSFKYVEWFPFGARG